MIGGSMETDDSVTCCVCSEEENDLTAVITCMYCFSSSHLKCRGITNKSAHRMREKPYFCSTKCADIYQKITEMQRNDKSLISSISSQLNATVTKVVETQMKQVKAEVKSVTTAVESSQNFLSEKFDKIVSDFNEMKSDNTRLNLEVDLLKRSHSDLAGTVYKLESSVDKTNKLAVSHNLIVLGLPSSANENIMNIVNKTFACIGVDVASVSFTASRLYSKPKNSNIVVPIRVIFDEVTMKDYVLDKKREFGQLKSNIINRTLLLNGNATNIAIREEMTPLGLELLKEMRDNQKSLNIKFVWPGRGGVVLVKKTDDSPTEKIANRDDLNRLIARYKNINRPCSDSSSPGQEQQEGKKRKVKK